MTWREWRECLRNIILTALWAALLLFLALIAVPAAAALVWQR